MLLVLESHQVGVESRNELELRRNLGDVGEDESEVHGASWNQVVIERVEDDFVDTIVDAADDVAGDSHVGDAVGVGDLRGDSLR